MIGMQKTIDPFDELSIGAVHGSPGGEKSLALGAAEQRGLVGGEARQRHRFAPANRTDAESGEGLLEGTLPQAMAQHLGEAFAPREPTALERDGFARLDAADAIEREEHGAREVEIARERAVRDPIQSNDPCLRLDALARQRLRPTDLVVEQCAVVANKGPRACPCLDQTCLLELGQGLPDRVAAHLIGLREMMFAGKPRASAEFAAADSAEEAVCDFSVFGGQGLQPVWTCPYCKEIPQFVNPG